MFKSQQYRVKATECGELVKSSTGAEESRKFQDLENASSRRRITSEASQMLITMPCI
jgi:hypothetical protein